METVIETMWKYDLLKGNEKYKPLPKIIDKHQYRYEQIWRKGRIAIYKQSYRPNSGFENINPHYEVIIIRLVKEDTKLGIPAREAYPSTIDWSTKGWTYFTYEEAVQKVGKLLLKRRFS